MAWEDCVVDVHSINFSQNTLEAMFSKCGAVRSVIHWKGQGEKQHVFIEYRSPSAAESARAIGLDRSDLQVIKLSNNEMLKRKFRELEKLSGNRPRSIFPNSERNTDVKVGVKDHSLPPKPVSISAYTVEREAEGRYKTFDSERSKTRDEQSGLLSASFSTSACPSSLPAARPGPSLIDHSRTLSSKNIKPAVLQPDSTSIRDLAKTDTPDSRSMQDPVSNHGYSSVSGNEALFNTSRSSPSSPSEEALAGTKSMRSIYHVPPTVIEIPHAGEVIRFDLDKQLEPNPAGIICMLSNVKADQKLWMMTAAYYNGKHNLEAARKVLEAGIDLAVQNGVETDTKPFWHLLSQINNNLKAGNSVPSSALSSSMTPSIYTFIGGSSNQNTGESVQKNVDKSVGHLPSMKEEPHLSRGSNNSVHAPSHMVDVLSSAPKPGIMPTKTYPLPHHISAPFAQHSRPVGPRDRDLHLNPCAASPVSQSEDTPARLHILQSEIDVLREKQTAVLEDLSLIRAAKRRAEDEVREERSIRRKLEKHLRAAEDALSRSKRMEDAALDQVKREVEARRKAEELFAAAKAEKDRAGGTSLFTHPSANDAAMLLQLASMIRAVPSNDFINPWQSGIATSGTGVTSSTAGSQPDA